MISGANAQHPAKVPQLAAAMLMRETWLPMRARSFRCAIALQPEQSMRLRVAERELCKER